MIKDLVKLYYPKYWSKDYLKKLVVLKKITKTFYKEVTGETYKED